MKAEVIVVGGGSTGASVAFHLAKAIRRFPIFERAFHVGGWAGISDDTPDGYPILSELPIVQGFYCAFGMSGHGFKLAPMMGKAIAELIVDGRSKDFNLEEYRYNRFKEERPIKVPFEYSWGQASPLLLTEANQHPSFN